MITVVIPARDERDALSDTLASLEAARGDFEVVLCWSGRCAWPGRRAFALRAVSARRVGRAAQMNQGAACARGETLAFLHADGRLPADGLEEASRALEDPGVAGGAWRLAFDRPHPALDLLARLSALPWRAAFYGDQGFFCRRRDFERAGGFPDVPLFEDVALARTLRRRGRLVRLRGTVVTRGWSFERRGPWRQLALNAGLVGLYWAGASPARLAGWYRAPAYSYRRDSIGSRRAARRAG